METKDYVSPTGSPIVGTYEVVYGTANISGISDTGEPVHSGYTEIDWDSQKTVVRQGQILFVDDDGQLWTFDKLQPVDAESEEA